MMKLNIIVLLLLIVFSIDAGFANNKLTSVFHRGTKEYFPDNTLRQLAEFAASGDVDRIEQFSKSGIDIDSPGLHGVTPLAWAVGAGNFRGVEKLLQIGANPNRSFEENSSILTLAIDMKNLKIYSLLLDYKGDPNWEDDNSRPAIVNTLFLSDTKFLEITLKRGGNPNLFSDVSNLLERAIRISQFNKAVVLLNFGARADFASLRAQKAIIGYMKTAYWAHSKNPDYIECLRLLRGQGLVIEIAPDAPTKK